ncbi:hypothetical protein [Tropicibacter sp. S64]|uniref:hypothetical protein n=1 Tax=Tropicibacter sp. S64 TaxID=3415122 RepID=UPI003C7C6D5F
MSRLSQSEIHRVHRIGWLRAEVLGANDGLVSTASLVVGVAAGGDGVVRGAARITLWGALAIAATAAVGALFGGSVG